MSRSEPEATRIVREWLNEGVTALPDRVLDVVLDQLPATPQRPPSRLAWRSPFMSNTVRIALTATAAVVVALLGFNYFANQNTGSPGVESPTPAPSPTLITGAGDTNLSAGRYLAGEPLQYGVGFDVPSDGWTATIGGPFGLFVYPAGDDLQGVSVVIFTNVSADPCAGADVLVPAPGPTVNDLVTAFNQMPGVQVADQGDITVDGYSGTKLTLTASEDYGQCTLGPDGYVIWTLPLGGTQPIPDGGQVRLQIIDVDGQRMVVATTEAADISSELQAHIDAIVNSITIDPLP